jgi:lipopolysaccharide assembly outer membrane protein LptD (OstA)
MVLRIEYILIISLLVLSFFIFEKEPKNIRFRESNCSKELLFEELYLLDINQSGVLNQLKATKIIKYKEYFEAENIDIIHQKIYHAIAKKAIYKDKIVSMEGNITLKKDNYLEFKSDDLIYKMRDKTIYVKNSFAMEINGSNIYGSNLTYNMNQDSISADNINATILY